MKLPPPQEDLEYTYAREHDLDEVWDPSRQPHVSASHSARFALLRDLVARRAKPPARILDVGCAQGTLGLQLAEAGYSVSLLDIRASHIEYARARYERGDVRFLVGELSTSVPPDSDFDVVVCTEVLEHVARPAHLLERLAEKTRVGGAILLTTPNADYALSRLPTFATARQEVIETAEPNSRDGDAHRFLYRRDELVAIVRSVGLRIEQTGFFLPFWLEGHLKTRVVHRAYFRFVHRPVRLGAGGTRVRTIDRLICSAQFVVATRA